jgi:hypothetical protein
MSLSEVMFDVMTTVTVKKLETARCVPSVQTLI